MDQCFGLSSSWNFSIGEVLNHKVLEKSWILFQTAKDMLMFSLSEFYSIIKWLPVFISVMGRELAHSEEFNGLENGKKTGSCY